MPDIPCRLCGSARYTVAFTAHDHISGEVFRVVRCDDCGLLYVNPQPAPEVLSRYYPATHQVSAPAAYERMDARPRIRAVSTLLGGRPGRILDVGCGKGLLLAGLKDLGWQVAGVELSEVSARYALSLGVEVCTQSLESCGYKAESFDVVTLFHSLEHMADPLLTLRTIDRLLRPGGYLLLEVPNAGSWYARLFGEHWFHCDAPRHLFHFSRDTLGRAVAQAGFRPVHLTTLNVQYDAFGAVQSALNLLTRRKNLLNDFNTGEVALSKLWHSPHRWRDLADLALSEVALALGFPLMCLVAIVLNPWVEGGTLRMVAVKPPERSEGHLTPAQPR